MYKSKEVLSNKYYTMSHQINDQWIESAYESFNIALSEKDVALAKDIIADTFDAGFSSAARRMNVMLREASSKWEVCV